MKAWSQGEEPGSRLWDVGPLPIAGCHGGPKMQADV